MINTKRFNRALVTGGSGYFGERLIDYLKKKNIKIYSLDINPPSNKNNIEKFFQLDVLNIIKQENLNSNIDIIYHCIATIPLKKNKELFIRNNIEGTRSVLNACKKFNIKNLVILSSSAVYGVPNTNPVNENTKTNPVEDYGKTKLESEKLCFSEKYKDLNISIIRPRTIMGHGRLGIFEILFDWIKNGHNIPVFDKGKNIYQFVHTDDLADACYKVSLLNKTNCNIFNCGAEKFSTMYDVLNHLCNFANSGSKIKSVPMKLFEPLMNAASFLKLSPLAPYHALMYGRSLYFDNLKLKKLGWRSSYSNNQMFEESYKNFLLNYNYIYTYSKKSDHKNFINKKILNLIKYII